MKPSGCKAKGSAFELDVAKALAKALNISQKKYLQRSPESGARPVWKGDVVPVGALVDIWPFHVECKKREGWDLYQVMCDETGKSEPLQWFIEACEQAYDTEKVPLIVFARNFRPWLIAYPFELYRPTSVRAIMNVKVSYTQKRSKVLTIVPFKAFIDDFLKVVYLPKVQEIGISEAQD